MQALLLPALAAAIGACAVNESYELELLAGARKWLTANQRLHWRARSRITAEWRTLAELTAVTEKLPHFDKALVICELRFPDRRRRDPANWAPTAKACVDGLVDAGVFDDDDWTRVTGPDMRIGLIGAREQRGMVLKIYPEER